MVRDADSEIPQCRQVEAQQRGAIRAPEFEMDIHRQSLKQSSQFWIALRRRDASQQQIARGPGWWGKLLPDGYEFLAALRCLFRLGCEQGGCFAAIGARGIALWLRYFAGRYRRVRYRWVAVHL
ncbi:hypothetical protein D3C80_1611280 [compost metagenome]